MINFSRDRTADARPAQSAKPGLRPASTSRRGGDLRTRPRGPAAAARSSRPGIGRRTAGAAAPGSGRWATPEDNCTSDSAARTACAPVRHARQCARRGASPDSAHAGVHGGAGSAPRAARRPAASSSSASTIKLKGVEISDCDLLVVEGHVEATVHSKAMQIAKPGTLKGTALIDVAEVHGEFTGELTARTRLVVHGTGRVAGTIRYGRLVVADGGTISGDVKDAREPRRRPSLRPRRPVAAEPARGELTFTARLNSP